MNKRITDKETYMVCVFLVLALIAISLLLGGCAQGDKGDTGVQGPQGVPGANGVDGTNGQDATPVTVVQFCPGVTPIYPSSFPEYGVCIQGQLYGVYSQNGGFLALLPPGTYNSNGINASCTFTITANCGVQQ